MKMFGKKTLEYITVLQVSDHLDMAYKIKINKIAYKNEQF